MLAACALARPNTFRVGSPATTSRKCPASRCRVRIWRSIFSRVAAPTSAMNSGIRGSVKAMIAAEIQSCETTAHEHDQRHDRGQQKLWQVQREVAVERVQPARGEHRQLAGALRARAVQAEPRDALNSARAQL